MAEFSRRDLMLGGIGGVVGGAMGFAAANSAQPLLRDRIGATETSGDLGDYEIVLASEKSSEPRIEPTGKFAVTEPNILGPYHVEGTPFRGKVTPPLEPGEPMLIKGRVWGVDSRKPISGAMIDIWQANAKGRYDNDDPGNPPKPGVFVNRIRLITDEDGRYEYETIKPGRYSIGRTFRPAHIHYMVRARGYRKLVTQLYFKGDPFNKTDRFIRPSLIIDPAKVKVEGGTYQLGVFDIVLAKG